MQQTAKTNRITVIVQRRACSCRESGGLRKDQVECVYFQRNAEKGTLEQTKIKAIDDWKRPEQSYRALQTPRKIPSKE